MAALCAWDLDGTLIDTLGDICLHVNRTLTHYGRPERLPDEIRPHIGHGAKELIRGVLGEEAPVAEAVAFFRQSYFNEPVVLSVPFPGAHRAIERLKSAGIANAVVTNKPADITERILKRLDLADLLVAIEGARPELPLKPDPTLLRRAVASTGAIDVVMVGDSTIDLDTARAFGCGFCGVVHGMDRGAGLRAAGVQPLPSLDEAAAVAAHMLAGERR